MYTGNIVWADSGITPMGVKTSASGAAQYIYAQALTSITANVACRIRASSSGYIARAGSTMGIGSNASCCQGPLHFTGVVNTTVPSGSAAWFQCGGLATVYVTTGTTIAAGDALEFQTASRVGCATALHAAYATFTGQQFQAFIAQQAVAVGSVPATYVSVFIVPGQHEDLLTT